MTRQRLIDADDLLEKVKKIVNCLNNSEYQNGAYDTKQDVIDLITNAPTIESEASSRVDSGEAVAWRVIGEGGIPVTDWIDGDGKNETPAKCIGGKWIQVAYTSPQKQWVELTDSEISDLSREMVKGNKSVNWLAGKIQALLKEVNHG
jgi:hypothetical protein